MQILPLGQGDLDLGLLKTIRDSGYHGPIGIIGHTMDDAEAVVLLVEGHQRQELVHLLTNADPKLAGR